MRLWLSGKIRKVGSSCVPSKVKIHFIVCLNHFLFIKASIIFKSHFLKINWFKKESMWYWFGNYVTTARKGDFDKGMSKKKTNLVKATAKNVQL